MTDTSFCTKCGMRVSEDALYCPACGAPIEGRVDPNSGMSAQQVMEREIAESRMRFITMLLLIYGIPALVSGLYFLLSVDKITSILVVDDMVNEAMNQYSLTEADVKSMLTYGGVLVALSGALSLVSAVCVYKHKFWIVAVISAGAASILCTMSLFGVLIGLLVTWMIISARSQFEEQNTA